MKNNLGHFEDKKQINWQRTTVKLVKRYEQI